MEKNLIGKIAVVTGGSGVLGSNVSQGLLEAGATVLVIGAHQEKVDSAVERLNKYGEVHGLVCNVLDSNEIGKARDFVMEKWGRVDILVNAAGGNVPGATIMDDQHVFDMKDEDLRRVIDLNLYGTIYPCLAFGKIMAEQKSGSIINVSSMAAYDALSRVMGYSIAKEGVNALTKWFAQEMAIKYSEKIRVNAIAPGFFLTEQNRTLLTNEDGSYTERGNDVIRQTPFKRFGRPEELCGTIQYLISDAAAFVTGTVAVVDGGFNTFAM